MRKVDLVWQDIFHDFPIIEEVQERGRFEITAEIIKRYYEPRLVTKFDFSQALPEVMRDNHISILPNTTGSYLLGDFNIFKDFPAETDKVYPVSFPDWIESIDPNNIQSEAVAIAAATITPMFADFFGDDRLVGTVSGRMGSGHFDFLIGTHNIEVNSSQIEIDGALESPDRFVLLEGKNVLHDDFIVRQLYYPYRTFKNKINKPIHSVFITYSNNVYRLMEYRFADPMHYDSCEFVREKKYCIDSDAITLNDILQIYKKTQPVPEDPKVPYIQCDSFSKIINIVENLANRGDMTEEDITELFGFTPRQGNYYYNGCRFLGLVQKEKQVITLTERGTRIINSRNYKEKQLVLAEYILEHAVFREMFDIYLRLKQIPDKKATAEIMRKLNVCGESLIDRRSVSTLCWFRWLIALFSD